MSDSTPPDPSQITAYLERIAGGDDRAIGELLPYVYEDLRRQAGALAKNQWRDHTLQPTALVHEAYMRMASPGGRAWENRRHFMNVAAMAMRQLLTDYANARNARKREGGHNRVQFDELDEPEVAGGELGADLVALDDALAKLAKLDPRQARIVELRFLAGLSPEDTAAVLGISERTVFADWKMARAWLKLELGAR